ncbi:UDP-N-acetylmuramoyl-L-alanyl-D-glutamate--2,6-diaminopimelate ligase [Oceanobacillus alkalisoli]|uniref:UDP-N-acetylmuramoyl-L-alanyl-D-glutamate--2, 6-diaminopimelate ligase n=1 Tax=Oceanobacillus alkalisoli TaxID=2925113 RepID=UPI001EF12611|nr:UDP-N-acetylmuramoyl-L-alanyl-D-glutamate--2,6-diaminopimelate ligase [Oceanobacillus alkalisoli]MCF3942521.1 UDP-N-acetylmuramoyl-L-alanyl-D-glutamate--2,6-diaminopimelate ligase [Oceanobacillus alkalisoli]MCG5103578.1 UDP-N-acetylmuramoyl-L-alanyl-D-glutamate--2,6-diaminopimelate ligase [Oceanobacillus alkalisoli]
MKLGELIQALPFISLTTESEEIEITAIHTDSRRVTPGSLFTCIEGFQTDGHLYVQDAIEKGAKVIIAEKRVKSTVPVIYVNNSVRALAIIVNTFYDYPSTKLPLIGITGTNGKTTVSYLLDALYNHFGKKTGVIGTIHNKVGDRYSATSNTTPDALILQQLFHDMQNSRVEQVIMEVSSHGLDLGRVYGCDFDTVIFTNLTQDHLDYHKSEENYFFAKSQLFSRLGNTYDGRRKFSVINADDHYAETLKKTSAFPIVTYGIEREADVMAYDIELLPGRTIFQLKTPVGTVKITSRLTGKFNIYNMLAAGSAALVNGIPLHIIKDTFEVVPPIPGRFETVDFGQPFGIIVDYAHTPHAVKNILETCKEIKTGKLYCVLGCGGDRDPEKRPLMAQEAIKHADYAIFTSDNPRTEDPRAILDDMVQIFDGHVHNYEVIIDRLTAIEKAMSAAEAGDLVVIAGKGHETYQEINGRKYPFDDRVVAKNAFLNKEF